MEFEGRHFSNNLRKYRKLLGYKQKDAAEMLGVHVERLCLWEKGERFPELKYLFKLSIIYQTLLYELFEEVYKEAKEELKDYKAFACMTDKSKQK